MEDHTREATHVVPMGNYVIAGVRNYVIENPSNLGNFMIADTTGLVTDRCWKQRSVTSPVAISSAANSVVVPLRLSSWVCFSGIPGRKGRIGSRTSVRSRVWIWVFSSIQTTTALAGGAR